MTRMMPQLVVLLELIRHDTTNKKKQSDLILACWAKYYNPKLS